MEGDSGRMDSKNPAPHSGFWSHQFKPHPTGRQIIFDVLFGIVLPVICVAADPFVFQPWDYPEPALFQRFIFFSYAEIAIGIIALIIWLFFRPVSVVLGGILIAGALFSFAVGCLLIPFSIVGLIVFIGALGFLPLITAFVYLRNGIRALRGATGRHSTRGGITMGVAVLVLVLLVPGLLQFQVNKLVDDSIEVLLEGESDQSKTAIRTLKWLKFDADLKPLVRKWGGSDLDKVDSPEKEFLAEAYREITGMEISDHWISILMND